MSIETMKQALEALENTYALRDDVIAAKESLRQAIAVYESAPPECQTEAEKTAFAFGWWKAMETKRAEKQEPVAITNEMAFAFHRVLSDGSISKDETEEIKRGLESAFAHMITHPQPKQKPVELISKTPPLYPTQKEGETFSVEYYEIDTQPKRYVATPREWVGLTDEEIEQGCKESWVTLQAWQSAVWWAEAKLKQKNSA
jgi:hypothetical protein